MAFTTSQNIDQFLTRGLSFRLPNNAPISSLYTLYANGAGQTYWSNSINPTDLSTLSTTIGFVGSTVTVQGNKINELYGQISTLSTGTATSMCNLSNFFISTMNSTILGISTFSTFYSELYALSNATNAQFSSFSTFISQGNAAQSVFLTSTLTSSMNGLVLSSSTGLSRQISTMSTSVVFFPTFYSTTNRLMFITLSTSSGLQTIINANNLNLSTQISTLRVQMTSTNNVLFSSINGYGNRVVSLESLSTNLSTISGRWISSQIGVSQSTQNALYNTRINGLSSAFSTAIINLDTQLGILSSISSAVYSSILSNISTNEWQTNAISTLSRNLSILTTSSILAGVYDTFMQLEAYTTNLINSTIDFTYYWQSSLFISTLNQSAAIADVYFSTFTGNAYLSTVSATTALSEQYLSTFISTIFDASLSTISDLNSTAIGVNYSTGYSYLINELGIITNPLNSTVVFFGSNAGSDAQGAYGVAIGYNAGQTNQGSNSVAIGHRAALYLQGISSIAIGVEAGLNSMGDNTIAIGSGAGNSNMAQYAIAMGAGAGNTDQQTRAVSIGVNAGNTSQDNDAVAIGTSAGRSNQGGATIAIGYEAGMNNQTFGGIAIGYVSGKTNQSASAIAIGPYAGWANQGPRSISIGYEAGESSQGNNTIAIGEKAGYSGQHHSTIILNATGNFLNSDGVARLFVAPIRNDETITSGFLHYNAGTKEIVYNAQGGGGGVALSTITSTFTMPIYVSTMNTLGDLYINSVTSSNITGAGSNFAKVFQFAYTGGFTSYSYKAVACDSNGNLFGFVNTGDSNGAYNGGSVVFQVPGGSDITSLSDAAGFLEIAMSANGLIVLVNKVGSGYLKLTTDGGSIWNDVGTSQQYKHIAMTPSGQYMYATTNIGSLYYSSNFGSTWALQAGMGFIPDANLAISDNGVTLYTGTGTTLKKSINNGVTWATVATAPATGTINSVDMTGDGLVIAYVDGYNIRISLNSGTSFSAATITGGGGLYQHMALSRNTGQYMIVSDVGNATYLRSYDYGSNFVVSDTTINDPGSCVVNYGGTCAGGTRYTAGGSNYRFISFINNYVLIPYKIGVNTSSPNYTFDISGSLFASSIAANTILVSSINTSSLFASSIVANTTLVSGKLNTDDIYTSTARGLAFVGVNAYGVETARITDYSNTYTYAANQTLISTLGGGVNGEGRWTNSISLSGTGKYVLIGKGNGNDVTGLGYMYRSEDYGASFNRVGSAGQCNWNGFAMSRSGEIMYSGCGGDSITTGALFKSENYGLSWYALSSLASDVWAKVACSGDGRIVIVIKSYTNGYINISYDYGYTFTSVYTSQAYVKVAMSITGQYIILSKYLINGIIVSSDYGQTWRDITNAPLNNPTNCVCISACGKYQYVGYTGDIVYYSSDYGLTWSTSNPGLSSSSYILDMTCDDSGKYLLITVTGIGGGFSYSSDYGQNYTVISNSIYSIGAGISPNSQIMIWLQRPSIYKSVAPTYFPANVLTTSTIATTARFNIMNVSTVGIGTPLPAYQLELSADSAAKPTTNTWTISSDKRIKKNIISANLQTCLTSIESLPLRYFEWDTAIYDNKVTKDRRNLGFIAQEVINIFPKSVDILPEAHGLSSFHTLNVDQIYKAHIGATQQLAQIVKIQQSTIFGQQVMLNIHHSSIMGILERL